MLHENRVVMDSYLWDAWCSENIETRCARFLPRSGFWQASICLDAFLVNLSGDLFSEDLARGPPGRNARQSLSGPRGKAPKHVYGPYGPRCNGPKRMFWTPWPAGHPFLRPVPEAWPAGQASGTHEKKAWPAGPALGARVSEGLASWPQVLGKCKKSVARGP